MEREVHLKEYELAYLAEDEKGADVVRAVLTREGGEIFAENPAERITLAYKINKKPSAYFGWFHFRLPPEMVAVLNRELKTKPEVMRFLIITPPFIKSKPKSAPKKSKPSVAEAESKSAPPPPPPPPLLSNEDLEKKIEEILKE
jgi:ribosomal protein S6